MSEEVNVNQAEETQEIPINMEGGSILDTQAFDAILQEKSIENPLGIQIIPGTLFVKLMNPPVFRFTWHGKDILGNEYCGNGATTEECHDNANKAGAVHCHMDRNPNFIEPEAEIQPDPNAKENNSFYAEGFADGDAAYQDVKALILAWVSDQMLSSNPGFAQDVESLPFVTYVRYNR